MHAKQSEKPGLAGNRRGLAKTTISDIPVSVDDDQQELPWWEEWGNIDNEWGELDSSEQDGKRKGIVNQEKNSPPG